MQSPIKGKTFHNSWPTLFLYWQVSSSHEPMNDKLAKISGDVVLKTTTKQTPVWLIFGDSERAEKGVCNLG